MNSDDTSSYLLVESSPISVEESETVRASYFREARRDVVATFLVVTFLMSGAAVIFFKLFLPFRFDAIIAFGIGALFGVLAVAWLLVVGFRDFFELRADLLSGNCEVLNVSTRCALRVSLNDKFPAIALDCGDRTLVLAGNWWEHRNRTEIWRDSRERSRFPASRFVLRRLPRSGRLLAVEVDGNKLQIQENDPIEPLLQVDSSVFMESYYVNKPIDNVLTTRAVSK